MTKTETKIAVENIRAWKINKNYEDDPRIINNSKQHKGSCQRFLEFLNEEMKRWETTHALSKTYISTGELEEKITDLKNAIKKYDEAGI